MVCAMCTNCLCGADFGASYSKQEVLYISEPDFFDELPTQNSLLPSCCQRSTTQIYSNRPQEVKA